VIHNARVQLFATGLNNLGVGAVLAGIIAPSVSGTVGDVAHISAWLLFAAGLFVEAQLLLGRLR
jgi:hypothetical protein